MPRFKKGSQAAKNYMAKIRASKKVSGTKPKKQTGTSNVKIDKRIQAKPIGKRIVKHSKNKSSVYYENRANRSDKGVLLGVSSNNDMYKVRDNIESNIIKLVESLNSIKSNPASSSKTIAVNARKKAIQHYKKMLREQNKLINSLLK